MNKFAPILFLLCVICGQGCGTLLLSDTRRDFFGGFQSAVMSHPDPQTVKEAIPAYLLLLDGVIQNEPRNSELLCQAALLYTSYAGLFIDEPRRAAALSERAFEYARSALCLRRPETCGWREHPFEEFEAELARMKRTDAPALYALGVAWAGWIRSQGEENLDAFAEVARVEALLAKVLEFDETYQDGGAQLYLGALNSLFSPALGGKPEVARRHFERALEISGGKNLMIKTLFARQYARQTFDRELHDRLLREVLEAEAGGAEYRMINALAKIEAQQLLDSADEFF